MALFKKKKEEEIPKPKEKTEVQQEKTEVQQMDLSPETPITIKDEKGAEVFVLKTTTDKLLFEMLMTLKQLQETNK